MATYALETRTTTYGDDPAAGPIAVSTYDTNGDGELNAPPPGTPLVYNDGQQDGAAVLAVNSSLPNDNIPFDVALYRIPALALRGQEFIGETVWASDDEMHSLYVGLFGIDYAPEMVFDEVDTIWDAKTRTLIMDVDPEFALETPIDSFNAVSNDNGASAVIPIEAGRAELTFSEDYSMVEGFATFAGTREDGRVYSEVVEFVGTAIPDPVLNPAA